MNYLKKYVLFVLFSALCVSTFAQTKVTKEEIDLLMKDAKWYSRGDRDKAIEIYSEVIRLQPDNYEALYQRGILYFDYENDKALNDFNAALKIKPNHIPALDFRRYIYL